MKKRKINTKGKNNGHYIDGRTLKSYYCKDCNKKLSNYKAKRCKPCAQSKKVRTVIWNRNIGKSSKKRWKDPKFRKKVITKIIKHHIYGKKFKNIKKISRYLHKKLHTQAYYYILEIYGKKGINKYIKWFDKKYNLKT